MGSVTSLSGIGEMMNEQKEREDFEEMVGLGTCRSLW